MKKLIFTILFLAFIGGDCDVSQKRDDGTFRGKISGTIIQGPPNNYIWRINSEAVLTFKGARAILTYKYVSSTQENKLKDGLPIYLSGDVTLEGNRSTWAPDAIIFDLEGTDKHFTFTVGHTETHKSVLLPLKLKSSFRVKSEDKNTKTIVYIGKIGFDNNYQTAYSENKTYNLEYELSGFNYSP